MKDFLLCEQPPGTLSTCTSFILQYIQINVTHLSAGSRFQIESLFIVPNDVLRDFVHLYITPKEGNEDLP